MSSNWRDPSCETTLVSDIDGCRCLGGRGAGHRRRSHRPGSRPAPRPMRNGCRSGHSLRVRILRRPLCARPNAFETPSTSLSSRSSKAAGLTLAPEASKRVLVRRLYFDLIGLPPTPEEVEAYVDDEAPDAWTKLVDKLLDDRRYGERQARSWLDLASLRRHRRIRRRSGPPARVALPRLRDRRVQ